jgi:serine/threonine-protein kinase
MNKPHANYAASVVAVMLTLGATQRAAAEAPDVTTASALFAEGREALQANNLNVACQKFSESQRLEPKVGTLLNLAQCKERLGQLIEAARAWQDAVALAEATSDTRVSVARERAVALSARIPQLSLRLEIRSAQGLSVRLDGTELELAALERWQPLDPGTHRVEVSAPTYARATSTFNIAEGERRELSLSLGARLPKPEPAAAKPNAVQVTAPTLKGSLKPAQPEKTPARKYLTITLAGVAATGVTLGTVFGLRAIDKNRDSQRFCDADDNCQRDGLDLREQASTAANWSTVSFVVGAGALTSAVLVWVLGSPKSSGSAQLALKPARLEFNAQW